MSNNICDINICDLLDSIDIDGMSLARRVAIDLLEERDDVDDLEGDEWYAAEDEYTEYVEHIFELIIYHLKIE